MKKFQLELMLTLLPVGMPCNINTLNIPETDTEKNCSLIVILFCRYDKFQLGSKYTRIHSSISERRFIVQ